MKYYITKYALNKGILEVESIIYNADTVSFQNRYSYEHVKKPFWHVIKEDAIKHAKEMKELKLKSLRKQIEKIEGLKFND